MARRCPRGHSREVLRGALATQAALYPHQFSEELAALPAFPQYFVPTAGLAHAAAKASGLPC